LSTIETGLNPCGKQSVFQRKNLYNDDYQNNAILNFGIEITMMSSGQEAGFSYFDNFFHAKGEVDW
jgi:hypothetical protein